MSHPKPTWARRSLALVLSLSLCWPSVSLATNLPDLGDVSQQGLSPQQEREIGEMAMREIRRSGVLLDDPEVAAFLNTMGYRLVEAAEVRDTQFTFFPILDSSVNAFAIPGGFIGVHTGLIIQAQHESEVASVLAHEIAHVSQNHLARMIEGMKGSPWLTLAGIAAAIIAGSMGRGDAAAAAIAATTGASVQRQLDFTYSFEQEADRLGMQTLQRSGYDPRAMAVFFERLQNHNRIVESNAPEFLRTHPVTMKRISEAQNRVGELKYRQVPDSPEFLFVREKVRAMQLGGREAISYFQKTIAEKRYASETAQRYGLAYAYFLARQYEPAWAALQQARDSFAPKRSHPMFEYLAGQIRLAQGQSAEALNVLGAASARYPASKALQYALLDALIDAGQFSRAESELKDQLSMYPSDALFYQRGARLYAKQGKLMQQYQMQGEYYARLKEYNAALEQFNLALRQPEQDFYLQSGIEARVRELESLLQSDSKK
ncbi:M48 family metalloprotease [Chitinibacter sp. ZOR0017]|uniref:M48 family metalloprotease n=1 Tax=Chitinibacter sp. ZOR0017 TaxID=1339254 RepID=UPI00064565A8|nr:M48 family metalloprotease [Chitinibacter sp. ZOR0017]